MRMLQIADLHLQHEWFSWVESQCTEFEALCISGDLFNAFSNTSMHDQAREISAWLLALRYRYIVPCTGNHDWVPKDNRVSIDVNAEGGWLKNLRGRMTHGRRRILGTDGDIVTIDGLKFGINGWLQIPSYAGRLDILVTHAPPSGCRCAIDSSGRDNGDPAIWDMLKYSPPRLILSGHIHDPSRHWDRWTPVSPQTLVLVPGCDETSAIPAHWIIDTVSHTATHNNGTRVRWE